MKKKDFDRVDHWSDLHLEVYCMLNIEYTRKKDKYCYVIDTNGENVEEWESDRFNPKNWKKVKNEDYDPEVKPESFPEGCKKKITLDCLDCKHVAYCELDVIKLEE